MSLKHKRLNNVTKITKLGNLQVRFGIQVDKEATRNHRTRQGCGKLWELKWKHTKSPFEFVFS